MADQTVTITVALKDALSRETRKVNQEFTKIETQGRRSARNVTKEFNSLEKSIEGIGKKILSIAGSFVAFETLRRSVLGALDAFIQFEAGLVGVGKTTNITGAELQALGEEIDKIGRDIPVTTDELLKIAQAAGQLGITASDDIAKFTDSVAKLTLTAEIGGEEAAIALARIQAVTGESTDSIDKLASVVTRLGNEFRTSEREIIAVASEVARSTAIFGVSAAESLAFGAALRTLNVRAEEAGSTFGRVFRELDRITAEGGADLELLSTITGETGETLRTVFQEDSSRAFEIFVRGLNNAENAGFRVADVLAQFGLEGTRINATIPLISKEFGLLGEALDRTSDELANTGALEREVAQFSQTLSSDITQASKAISELGRTSTEEAEPFLKRLTRNFTDLTRAVTDSFKVGDLGPLLEAFGTIEDRTEDVIVLVDVLRASFESLGAAGLPAGTPFGPAGDDQPLPGRVSPEEIRAELERLRRQREADDRRKRAAEAFFEDEVALQERAEQRKIDLAEQRRQEVQDIRDAELSDTREGLEQLLRERIVRIEEEGRLIGLREDEIATLVIGARREIADQIKEIDEDSAQASADTFRALIETQQGRLQNEITAIQQRTSTAVRDLQNELALTDDDDLETRQRLNEQIVQTELDGRRQVLELVIQIAALEERIAISQVDKEKAIADQALAQQELNDLVKEESDQLEIIKDQFDDLNDKVTLFAQNLDSLVTSEVSNFFTELRRGTNDFEGAVNNALASILDGFAQLLQDAIIQDFKNLFGIGAEGEGLVTGGGILEQFVQGITGATTAAAGATGATAPTGLAAAFSSVGAAGLPAAAGAVEEQQGLFDGFLSGLSGIFGGAGESGGFLSGLTDVLGTTGGSTGFLGQLGGVFSGLFGGGGGLGGGASTGSGGLISGILGSLLSFIPVVGPILGPLVGLLGFNEGGRVPGANRGFDDQLVRVGGNEHIIKSAAADFYGHGILNAINNMSVPREVFSGFNRAISSIPLRGFQEGGVVNTTSGSGSEFAPLVAALPVTEEVMNQLLNSPGGQRAFFNFERKNSSTLNKIRNKRR